MGAFWLVLETLGTRSHTFQILPPALRNLFQRVENASVSGSTMVATRVMDWAVSG